MLKHSYINGSNIPGPYGMESRVIPVIKQVKYLYR